MSEKTESAVTAAKLDSLQQRLRGDFWIPGTQREHEAEKAIASLREQVLAQAKEIERKDAAIREAVDLLTERKQGGHARSPNHNARLVLDAALSPAAQEVPASQGTEMVPAMPPTKDRQPYGVADYLEGNRDWAEENDEAVGWLADHHATIRAVLASPSPKES